MGDWEESGFQERNVSYRVILLSMHKFTSPTWWRSDSAKQMKVCQSLLPWQETSSLGHKGRSTCLFLVPESLPQSNWILVTVTICARYTSFMYFHNTHIEGLQAPSASQDVHLASLVPVTSSGLVTQRCSWHSHLQVWSGVKKDGIPKWHCCHLGWASCSWHVYMQKQGAVCSSKSIGTEVRATGALITGNIVPCHQRLAEHRKI